MAGRPREFDMDLALQKALSVFKDKGYEGASLDDLCQAMGITRPSLYKAYGNKEALFIAALSSYSDESNKVISDILECETDGVTALRRVLDWVEEINTSEIEGGGCLLVNSTTLCNEEHPQITAHIAGLHEAREALLTQRLERAKAEGQLQPQTEPRQLAQYINGVIQGIAVVARGQGQVEAVRSVVRLTNLTLDHV